MDTWKLEHGEKEDIHEYYTGKENIKEEDSLTYLGHVISKSGGNMPNIIHKRKKAIGTEKLILRLIKNLGPYKYTGALIYIQSLIRTSILYSAETMYNLTETEMRALEQIEESVLQKVFQTKRSCPRHILYLESGIYPARNQIHRQMLNFLHYILQQPSDSLIYRIFETQKNHPTKGDWVSCVIELVNVYDLQLSIEEIKNTKKSVFKNLVKNQVEKVAFEQLLKRQKGGQKGKKIVYENLEMADYLLPECQATPEEKSQILQIRSEMDDYPSNFGNKTKCDMGCSETLNSEHILVCSILNEKDTNFLRYEHILKGTMNEKLHIFRKIQHNNEKRKHLLRDSVEDSKL